jgi:hypothetical protein
VVKVTAGKPVKYKLPAYDDPRFFFVVGNLDGLEVDPYGGFIFGTSTQPGIFGALVLVAGDPGPVFFTLRLKVEPEI